MHWIIPALTAPFINAGNNFLDKYLVSGTIRNPIAMPVYLSVFGFLMGAVVWMLAGFFIPGIFGLFGVASGITTTVAAVAYFKLMVRKDVSEMIFYLGLTTPFILILSYIFLGETISAAQLAGFLLILFAASLVLFKKEEANLKWTKTLALIIMLDGMWALGSILMKFAINENSFIRAVCYEGWGMGLGGIMIYAGSPEIRNFFLSNFKNAKRGIFIVFGANELISIAGRWVEYFAYSIGPVALVSVVGGTQTFYCILLGIFLTLAFPKTFKENISRENVVLKLAAAAVMMAGLYLVYF